jgi:hypothetical protein
MFAGNPEDCGKLAGDNIPGTSIIKSFAPAGAMDPHHKYRSSYSTPLIFNNSKYSSLNVFLR